MEPQDRPSFVKTKEAKRRLYPPSSKKPLNPSSKPADITIKRSSSPSAPNHNSGGTDPAVLIEVDLSSVPQPFLDPEVCVRSKSAAEGPSDWVGVRGRDSS